MLFEEGFHRRQLFRVVHADADELKVAQAKLARGRDEFGKFFHARSAPRRPHIEEADFLRVVLPQRSDALRIDPFDLHFTLLPLVVVGDDLISFAEPLGGAAVGLCFGNRHRLAIQQRFDGIAGIRRSHRGLIHVA